MTTSLLTNREMEHLLTMSIVYQIAIGFIAIPFVSPIDPVGQMFHEICSVFSFFSL